MKYWILVFIILYSVAQAQSEKDFVEINAGMYTSLCYMSNGAAKKCSTINGDIDACFADLKEALGVKYTSSIMQQIEDLSKKGSFSESIQLGEDRVLKADTNSCKEFKDILDSGKKVALNRIQQYNHKPVWKPLGSTNDMDFFYQDWSINKIDDKTYQAFLYMRYKTIGKDGQNSSYSLVELKCDRKEYSSIAFIHYRGNDLTDEIKSDYYRYDGNSLSSGGPLDSLRRFTCGI